MSNGEMSPRIGDAQLKSLVDALAAANWVPGLRSTTDLFTIELIRSVGRVYDLRQLTEQAHEGTQTVPEDPAWDAWRAIAAYNQQGDKEEAIWLAILATHFGRREADEDPWRSARLMYSGFGERLLSWKIVATEPTNIITQVCKRHAMVCQSLRFSNHRKYETSKLGRPSGIDAVLCSYVMGIRARSRRNQATFFSTPEEGPEVGFERLMNDLEFIRRFGRTAKFDLLALLGNLGVYELRPGRIYLKGATGPLRGAQAMFGRGDRLYLEHRANKMAKCLNVPIQAVEDALCNWQKHLKIGG